MTPQRAQATNLLVPVCLSASHARIRPVRMEPQYMIIARRGSGRGPLAVRGNIAVQDVPIDRLQQILRRNHAILSMEEAFPAAGGK